MTKRFFAVFIAVGILFAVFQKNAHAQLYVFSSVDVLSDGSSVEGQCETMAVSPPNAQYQTQIEYYQVGVRCTADTPSGEIKCGDGELDWSNPTIDCSWTFPLNPGFHTITVTKH